MTKGLKILIVLVLSTTYTVFSQQKFIKHSIKKGETLSSIASKFDVKLSEISKLNPSANKTLKINSILLIPIALKQSTFVENEVKVENSNQFHEVKPKETLYGIAKQYDISLNDLMLGNPSLSSELKIGQKINLPENTKSIQNSSLIAEKSEVQELKENTAEDQKAGFFIREVLPKETKYSLTKQYGITIKEFDAINPNLGTKLIRVGQLVNIPIHGVKVDENSFNDKIIYTPDSKLNSIAANQIENNDSLIISEAKPKIKINNTQTITYEILPKETKYAIAKRYGITVKELENQNPEIKNKLTIGKKISITYQALAGEETALANTETNENLPVLTSTIDFNKNMKTVFNIEVLDQLIDNASQNLGTRYRTGGTSKSGFDCSGLIYKTFGEFDIKLPRTSHQQSTVGTVVNTEEAQKGDLIFFKTNGRRQINHVGMVVEVNDDEIKFIHSSTSNGVIISSTKERYYGKNFSQINRVVQ
ncbi:LysM domain-containing protein [Flavobacterium micromati]|uniref:LysM domain-containing protein n=1 Tax=Flavobacterium micromati TaxID=229205 RepID=A0A1M5KEJ9_9FLAO|nr:peptidoglycan endopeptidase [Flavobacterium micromati]SHG50593.1 LysM domain-containing protein [Flavobacterium micromati]